MVARPILCWPDPRLSSPCAAVAPGEDTDRLIADLFATMYAAPGRGLAAPQVGVLAQVFVIDCTWKDGPGAPMAFVNPRIVAAASETASGEEGCLSIPGITVDVVRPVWVVLSWIAPDGHARQQRFDGFAARCVQHELDHLNGIVTFDRLADAPRTAAEARYRAARRASAPAGQ